MASVKATNMSDGTNTAYFLNAIKVESDMLILYNEENQLMNSTVDLRDLRTQSDGEETSVSGDGRQKVYYANNYITESMAMGNCTSQFNTLIELVYNNGGGVIKLDGYIYRLSAIYLYSGVYIEGAGMGNTVIKRYISTQTGEIIDKDDVGEGFINIRKYSCNTGLRNLTLYTDHTDNYDTDDMVNYIEPDSEESIIHGILFEDCENANSSSNDSFNVVDSLELSNDPGSIIPNDENNEERVRKYTLIENVAIIGFSGYGVYIGENNKEVTLNNVQIISNFKTGIKNYGNDCVFNRIRIKNNCDDGIDNQGNNNRFSDIHLSSNGIKKHSGYALICHDANNNTFMNIHLIDNWCNGIYIQGNNNIFNGLLIDSNGYRSKFSSEGLSMSPKDTFLIHMNNCQKCILQASISNYQSTAAPEIPLKMVNSRYNIIDITQAENVASEKSNINGTEITDNITNETIFDNIVRYLQS